MNNVDILFLGLVFSGISALSGLIFAGYQTMKLREEKKQTLRAWIGEYGSKFDTLRYINQKNEAKTKKEWEKMSEQEQTQFGLSKVETFVNLKNFGQLPATVQGRHYIILDTKPTRRNILEVEYGEQFVMMPQGEQWYVFEDPIAIFHTSQGKTAYIIIELKYTSSNSKDERKYGIIAKLTRGAYNIIDSWDENTLKTKLD